MFHPFNPDGVTGKGVYPSGKISLMELLQMPKRKVQKSKSEQMVKTVCVKCDGTGLVITASPYTHHSEEHARCQTCNSSGMVTVAT